MATLNCRSHSSACYNCGVCNGLTLVARSNGNPSSKGMTDSTLTQKKDPPENLVETCQNLFSQKVPLLVSAHVQFIKNLHRFNFQHELHHLCLDRSGGAGIPVIPADFNYLPSVPKLVYFCLLSLLVKATEHSQSNTFGHRVSSVSLSSTFKFPPQKYENFWIISYFSR